MEFCTNYCIQVVAEIAVTWGATIIIFRPGTYSGSLLISVYGNFGYYLVTYGHVGFAYVMCTSQVCPFVTIHQGQTMKSFNSISGGPAPGGNVVLGSFCHGFQQVLEGVGLGLACM